MTTAFGRLALTDGTSLPPWAAQWSDFVDGSPALESAPDDPPPLDRDDVVPLPGIHDDDGDRPGRTRQQDVLDVVAGAILQFQRHASSRSASGTHEPRHDPGPRMARGSRRDVRGHFYCGLRAVTFARQTHGGERFVRSAVHALRFRTATVRDEEPHLAARAGRRLSRPFGRCLEMVTLRTQKVECHGEGWMWRTENE